MTDFWLLRLKGSVRSGSLAEMRPNLWALRHSWRWQVAKRDRAPGELRLQVLVAAQEVARLGITTGEKLACRRRMFGWEFIHKAE